MTILLGINLNASYEFILESLKICIKKQLIDYRPSLLIANKCDQLDIEYEKAFGSIKQRAFNFTHMIKIVEENLKYVFNSVVNLNIKQQILVFIFEKIKIFLSVKIFQHGDFEDDAYHRQNLSLFKEGYQLIFYLISLQIWPIIYIIYIK